MIIMFEFMLKRLRDSFFNEESFLISLMIISDVMIVVELEESPYLLDNL